MKTITFLALVLLLSLIITDSGLSQTTAQERLKYPLALDMPGTVYRNPGPVNTMPNPLEFFNINISQNSAPQNEPSVKISRKDTNKVVAAWRDFRFGIDPNANRRVGYSYSTNGGLTWSVSRILDSTLLPGGLTRNSDPVVAVDTAGNFYIAVIAIQGLSGGNLTLAVYKSTNGGQTFPQAFICSQSGTEDKEWLTTDLSSTSPFLNSLYISWTSFSLGGIKLTKSTNAGVNWSTPSSVSDVTGGVQGSDICISKDGQVNVVWLGFSSLGEVTYDRSTNGGTNFGTDQIIASGEFPSGLPNDVNTFPTIATDNSSGPRSGWIYVAFADNRNGDCDIFLTKSTNNGVNWSAPLRINNDPVANGKIQYWPTIAVNDAGNIAVLFMDTRNTIDNTTIEAYVARSYDGGVTFTNELLSTEPSPTLIPGSNVRFGDYIDLDYAGKRLVPVWTDERAGGFNQEIFTSEIDELLPVSGNNGNLPNEFSLSQNYPNPFNPSTRISFSLPKASELKIEVYSALGTLIKTIASGSFPAGKHSMNFNAGSLSSGVYFYKLTAGEFSETRSMILIK
ncbi:MAG TPA: T9SS type A sorting domain-containing protein [Ignavibacteria bacterium]|nr:T9SS type A sorting domain-containing protein [Ignavibacteria bacterium]